MLTGRIFVCADLHGNPRVIKNFVDSIDNPSKEDVIIVAGDAGFEYQDAARFTEKHHESFITHSVRDIPRKEAAAAFAGTWIVMRGNHDSCYWRDHVRITQDGTLVPDEGWSIVTLDLDDYLYENRYPNIWYVRDSGGIYTIGKYNFLFLPGAYSVDKQVRIARGWPYNPQEQLSEEEQKEMIQIVKDFIEVGGPIDYVIGHTFPLKLESSIQFLFIKGIDQHSVNKRTERWLDTLAELFEPPNNPAFKKYIGGHFHGDLSIPDPVGNGNYYMVYNKMMEL